MLAHHLFANISTLDVFEVFFWSGRLARSFTPGRLTLAEGKSWPTSCHWSGDKPFFFVETEELFTRKSYIFSVNSVFTQIKHSGTVSACGLAAGMPLPTTVIVLIFKKAFDYT